MLSRTALALYVPLAVLCTVGGAAFDISINAQAVTWIAGRGLHSSTFRLNLSASCGIGVRLRDVHGVFRRCQGVFRVYFVSEMAQVELRSGRVSAPGNR